MDLARGKKILFPSKRRRNVVFKGAIQNCCLFVFHSGEGYWVGKASLRSWRQLALDQLEEDEQETQHSNGQTNGQGPHTNNSKGKGMVMILILLLCYLVFYVFIFLKSVNQTGKT